MRFARSGAGGNPVIRSVVAVTEPAGLVVPQTRDGRGLTSAGGRKGKATTAAQVALFRADLKISWARSRQSSTSIAGRGDGLVFDLTLPSSSSQERTTQTMAAQIPFLMAVS